MTTWREAVAAKKERQRRERRFFTPDKVSKRVCPFCNIHMPKASLAAGENAHPTCGPSGLR